MNNNLLDIFRPIRLGVALGSGGDRGFAHIGVLKVLQNEGIKIDAITGSSIGAIVAAVYALEGNVTKLENFALKFSNKELLKLIDVNNPTVSLIKGKKIREFLKDQFFGEKTFSDTKLPLAIVATSLDDGGRYVFRKGKIIDAVMASCSLPGILPPVEVGNQFLIDGGLADAVPLEILDELGVTHKIGVDLYSCGVFEGEPRSMKEVLSRVYRLGIAKLSALHYYQNNPNTLMISPQTNEALDSLTFAKAKENILAGEEVTKTKLNDLKKMISKQKLWFLSPLRR